MNLKDLQNIDLNDLKDLDFNDHNFQMVIAAVVKK